jgi:hypothetical protein
MNFSVRYNAKPADTQFSQGEFMPKPNYAFAKRQRELAKKQKKEAKQRERDAAKAPPDAAPAPEASQPENP